MGIARYRSFNKEKGQFYYFLKGRCYSRESCQARFLISERVCSEFSWRNAEQYIGRKTSSGQRIYQGDKLSDSEGDDFYEIMWSPLMSQFVGMGNTGDMYGPYTLGLRDTSKWGIE